MRRKASNASCQGTGFFCNGTNKAKVCGYDNTFGVCFCATLYYGKIRPARSPVGACIENSFCDYITTISGDVTCTQQKDCPLGTVCVTNTCCETFDGYGPVCAPICQQGSIGQAKPLNTPKTMAHK